jgi:3,4-dihydroxy 2-butanone 4-phosphate synthase / GTP cyclohydrolase II
MNFSKTSDAVRDFKRGKFVIVLDEKQRENEADLIIAAEKITPSKVNFMITQARGLVAVPMLGTRLDELKIPLMTENNSEFTGCAFTVSVDAKKGTTTGISAYDRAKTIRALIDKKTRPNDLARPGHIFPLRSDKKGLRARQGHTEASMELCRLANLYPAAVICEIIGKNGEMMKIAELKKFASRYNLRIIEIHQLKK